MSIKNKIVGAFSTAVLGGGLALALASPAQATAAEWVHICNNTFSVDHIISYNLYNADRHYIAPGSCSDQDDDYGGARVDVDWGGHGGDVNSWYKGKNAIDHGPCYNNEDESSNPYSEYSGQTTYYRTFSWTGC